MSYYCTINSTKCEFYDHGDCNNVENCEYAKQCGPKCTFTDGIIYKPDGIHELDPCVYEETERYENVTVIISKCIHCGEIDIGWVRQDNTRKVDIEKEE